MLIFAISGFFSRKLNDGAMSMAICGKRGGEVKERDVGFAYVLFQAFIVFAEVFLFDADSADFF